MTGIVWSVKSLMSFDCLIRTPTKFVRSSTAALKPRHSSSVKAARP
jgi:hypothetical protein